MEWNFLENFLTRSLRRLQMWAPVSPFLCLKCWSILAIWKAVLWVSKRSRGRPGLCYFEDISSTTPGSVTRSSFVAVTCTVFKDVKEIEIQSEYQRKLQQMIHRVFFACKSIVNKNNFALKNRFFEAPLLRNFRIHSRLCGLSLCRIFEMIRSHFRGIHYC